ncbi:MAG: MgtC/SapB family protein [Verrucomicrobiales bacterium]|nr:MgtC/SapB family protein [Verrucomicrobiales bacterium]
MNYEEYLRPALALAIGLLIGMQRERKRAVTAGLRTFALIALSGYLCGLLAVQFTGWIIAAGILFLAVAFFAANYIRTQTDPDRHDSGMTTEVAGLLVFGIGVYLAGEENAIPLAVILGGVTALLLYHKSTMHGFVQGLEKKDVRAIMQFVLITLVILPILPNKTYGPFDVFNPFNAWLMVVLIVGIGLIGFLVYRVMGSRAGTFLSGALGGLVSSTATTVSASRFAKGKPGHAVAATLIIMIASVVSVVRIIVELIAVDSRHIAETGPPLALFLLVFIILTGILYYRKSEDVVELDEPSNPAELKPAIIFGVLYVLILFLVAFAKEYTGQAGLYVVGIISGLTDVDAITLSTGSLMSSGGIDVSTGWRVVLVAALSNLVFKGVIAGVLGGRDLAKQVLFWYGIALVAGLLIVLLWP